MPEWPEGTGCTVEAEPWLDIGLADRDSAYLFSRVAGIEELGTGEAVVADGSGQIRVFDTDDLDVEHVRLHRLTR